MVDGCSTGINVDLHPSNVHDIWRIIDFYFNENSPVRSIFRASVDKFVKTWTLRSFTASSLCCVLAVVLREPGMHAASPIPKQRLSHRLTAQEDKELQIEFMYELCLETFPPLEDVLDVTTMSDRGDHIYELTKQFIKMDRLDLAIWMSCALVKFGFDCVISVPVVFAFKQRLKSLVPTPIWNVIVSALGKKCVLAGGAVVWAIFEDITRHPAMDIDLWVSEEETAKAILRALMDSATGYVVCFNDRPSVFTFLTVGSVPIQIILHQKTPCEIVTNFDMDYVRAYFDGTSLMMAPEAWRAWNKRAVLCAFPTLTENRIGKAIVKGFQVDDLIFENKPSRKSAHRYYLPSAEHTRAYTTYILKSLFPCVLLETVDITELSMHFFDDRYDDRQLKLNTTAVIGVETYP